MNDRGTERPHRVNAGANSGDGVQPELRRAQPRSAVARRARQHGCEIAIAMLAGAWPSPADAANRVLREAIWDGLRGNQMPRALHAEAIHGAAEALEEVARILRQEAKARKL